MKLQIFTGGLATRQLPQYIGQTEAVVCDNVDFDLGALASAKGLSAPVVSAPSKFHHWYSAKEEWLFSDVLRSYVEYNRVLYWTDGVGKPKRYDGDAETDMGLIAPETAPALEGYRATAISGGMLSITAAEHDIGAMQFPNAPLHYAIVDTVPADPELEQVIRFFSVSTNNAITWHTEYFNGGPTFSPGTSKGKKFTPTSSTQLLYRWYQGEYRKVQGWDAGPAALVDSVYVIPGAAEVLQIPKHNAPLSYVYTYYDTVTGVESGPSPSFDTNQTEGRAYTPELILEDHPSGLARYAKRLYRLGGSLTRWTLVTTIDFGITEFIDDISDSEVDGRLLLTFDTAPPPEGLDCLTEAYAMLFAADGSKLRYTEIGQPENWPMLNFIEFGADIKGIAPTSVGVMVMTQTTTHLITGNSPDTLAKQLLDSEQGCISHNTIAKIAGAALWLSEYGLCISQGAQVRNISNDKLGKIDIDPVQAVIWNNGYYALQQDGTVFCYDFTANGAFRTLSLNLDAIAVAAARLYGSKDGQVCELFKGELLPLHYKSPRFVEGSATELKTYKTIYVYSKGQMQMSILIDDVVVRTAELEEGINLVQVPTSQQRGAYIQFEVTGVGQIFEIEYVVGARQND